MIMAILHLMLRLLQACFITFLGLVLWARITYGGGGRKPL